MKPINLLNLLNKTIFGGKIILSCLVSTTGLLNIMYFNKIDKKNRLNLIFDLDETLINSEKANHIKNLNMNGIAKYDYVFNYISENSGKKKQYYVWKRPFVNFIIKILSNYNNLYLLTSADKDYAYDICSGIKIDKYFIEKKCCDDIDKYNDENENDNDNDLEGKDIEIFSNINVSNSILIDDLISNNVKNQRFIHIHPYSFYKSYDFELIKLLLNITWLNTKKIFE